MSMTRNLTLAAATVMAALHAAPSIAGEAGIQQIPSGITGFREDIKLLSQEMSSAWASVGNLPSGVTTAQVSQQGTNNQATIMQSGVGNHAAVQQVGQGNSAVVIQRR